MTSIIIVAAVATIVLMGAGGLLTEIGPWYRNLRKPRLQPPDWLFGPAWTVILSLNAAAFVFAWRGATDPAGHAWVAIYFATNFVFHLLWSPLFFKLKRPDWALMEVPLLWLSVLVMVIGYHRYAPAATWMEVLYLLWVSFASWLNYTIVALNGPFTRQGTGAIGLKHKGKASSSFLKKRTKKLFLLGYFSRVVVTGTERTVETA